jgi:Putative Ig domain
MTRLAQCLAAALVASGLAAGGMGAASAAAPPTLNLKVLLVGEGSADVTTAAWQAALTSEGVPYTLVTATGTAPDETVNLPTLSSGSTGNYNGVVIADSPTDYAAGALSALDSYESSFGVRQVDGYMFPSPALGVTDATGGAIDGSTGTLTAAGLAAFPALKGPVPFDTGSFGYGAKVDAGAPYTPFLTNAAGNVMAGVYQHPSTGDAQAGVSELALNFDYNANQIQWLLLAPGLINWVTQDAHLGLYRNYFGQDVDDVFISDNEWSQKFQCTPAATGPPDFSCPPGVANNPADTPPDVQMSAADVAYVANWEQQTGINLNLAFNGVGACSADTTADESDANCTGSATDNGVTYTDPGQAVDASNPNDGAFVSALLGDQADFNWITHTWSHLFLGCQVAQPQALTSARASGSGGTFAAGSYSYEVTAATAYGESEPSQPTPVTVGANGSVTLTWPEAANGTSTDGKIPGPSLAQEEASHTGGTGFWGYNVYRENPGSASYGLVGQVAENPSATSSTTYSFTDTGKAQGDAPDSSPDFPTATNPGIDCGSGAGAWVPATSTTADSSIEQEIGLDQAFAAANGLTNYTPAAVVTGEHSGVENPNMPAALAGANVTTFAQDASRQPQQYSLGAALGAPRYPSNIFYNAANWPDELNEYNTLYVAQGDSLGSTAFPGETGHCTNTSATTCIATPATEATVLASESHIMLGHVLSNDPRVGYAHQSDLIGPAAQNGPDYGYTLLTLLNSMLSQYNSWYDSSAPLDQMTDVSEAQVLAEQGGWATAENGAKVAASEQDGVVTVTNAGSAVSVPVTVPPGTTVNGSPFGHSYGGDLSDWVNLGNGATETLTEHVLPGFGSSASATSIVGTAFSFTVDTTGAPTAAITESGALPAGITFKDNGDGTATLAGTAAVGSGGSYPIVFTAANSVGGVSQHFTLTNAEAPSITSPSTATFSTGVAGTYTVTTTGYPAAAITEAGTLPSGLSFTDKGDGTAAISGTAASGTAGNYPVTLSATNASGSKATLALTITVNAPAAPAITSASAAFFTVNQAGAVAVTTTGSPVPAITETGALPAGLAFADNGNGTALLSGTGTATGTTNLSIKASNGISPDVTQAFSVVVGQAPAFTSANSATATVGSPFSFTVKAGGYPAPSWGESNLPPGVTFTDNKGGTATLSGTPTTPGTYTVPLVATNAYGSVQQILTITAQQAPAITSASSAAFTVGTQGSFSVLTTGSPTAKITESGALPSGVTFTDNGNGTATLAGTPAAATSGSYPITITAANGVSPNAAQSFKLTVGPATSAPAITSAGSATFAAGQAGTFAVTTSGVPAAALSATSSPALPSGVTFKDNGNGTATLAGTPQSGSQGTYLLTIKASSSAGTASQSFTLTVNSGLAITSAATATATAGGAFSFTVTTTGSPAPTLSRAGTLPPGITFTANGNGTATLAGTATATDSGPYPITFTAKNSTGTASQAFTLTVDQVPAFSNAAAVTETAGTAFSFAVSTKGFPAPKLSTGSLPAAVSFADDGNGTGSLSGTTAVKAGTYAITVTAANGGGTASQTITLTVKAAGTKEAVPVFTSPAVAVTTAGKAFTFTVATAGSPTSYTTNLARSGTLPAGISFSNNGDGTGTLSGPSTTTSGGVYPITFTATNTGGTTTQLFVLIVNGLPSITSSASATATDGSGFNFTVRAAGAPAPTLTEAGALPQGLTWVGNANGTASLAGTPGVGQGGVYKLTVTAANTGGSTTQTFTLTVDQAPAVTSAPTAKATHGKAFSFTFTATGYPLPSVTHTGAVPGLTYTNNGNGTATLAGTPTTAGTYSLAITAKNSVGSATQAFTLTVS